MGFNRCIILEEETKAQLQCNEVQIEVLTVQKLSSSSVQWSSLSANWLSFLCESAAHQEAHAIWQPDRLQNIWAQQEATKLDRGSWTCASNKAHTPHCTRATEVADCFDCFSPLNSRQECDNLWWDAFTTEFFEDDAMLTITFCLEDGPKRYSKKPVSRSIMHESVASLD